MTNNPTISIICPCYNEENAITIFLERIEIVLNMIKKSYEIIFINDGSEDNTLNILIKSKEKFNNIRIINFSRNFGKEAALTAGIDMAKGEVIVPIDVDLQHPPELIIDFIKKWQDGYDIVLAKRTTRDGEKFSKKLSAKYFYSIIDKISDTKIPRDVGDFRLITNKVANAIKLMPENQRFMKGIFAWVGFKTTTVKYYQNPRVAGKSSFSGWKLWNLAINGITSFSTAPLRIWLYIGSFISLIAFIYGSFIVLKTIFFGVELPGYASLISIILFLGGIQLIGIGVLGEYIGKIYSETKRRPIYIIEGEY